MTREQFIYLSLDFSAEISTSITFELPVPVSKDSRAVRSLKELFDETPVIARAGASSELFLKWHGNVLKTLRASLGEGNSFLNEFHDIRFEMDPALHGAARRVHSDLSKRSVRGKSKGAPSSSSKAALDRAETRHFNESMALAGEVLLSAISKLRKG